jgi:threonine dehydratase
MSGTASALQLPNEGDLAQTSDLSTPKAMETTLPDTHANGNSMGNQDSARTMANGQHDVVDISASHSQDMGEIRSPQPTSLAQIMTSNSFTLTTPPSSPGMSYPPPLQLEYSSSAPMPDMPKMHTVANGDPDVPSHLYKRLPQHFLHKEEGSDQLVPDYMRMILLCEYREYTVGTAADLVPAKVYSPPLNLKETPLTLAVNLSGRLGCEVWLKREDLQPVFSFKIRGAYNLMASLTKEERWKGVVTCSAGNHAQGVALAGYHLKIPCTIVMPTGTPSIKWRNVERLGAKVVLHGQDFDEAKTECARLAKTYGLHFIPPYDDPMVVAGQGTVAVELARQIKDFESLDGIFASAGGGGLLAGISAYTKRIAPQMKVIGVETHDGDAMKRSIAAGKRVMLQEVGPFADGTAVKIVGEEPFRLCKNLLDEVVLVSNDEICAAIKDVFEGESCPEGNEHPLTLAETRAIPEPSGALGLAGLKAYIQERGLQNSGKRFVAVVSGANMNFGRLRFVAERAELGERREVLMGVKIPEQPGS